MMFTVGCSGAQGVGVRAQPLVGDQAGAPVVVSCEPNQRTIVRPSVVNGVAMSQVECVTTGQPAGFAPVGTTGVPVTYRQPRVVTNDVALQDARVIPASYPVSSARPVRAQQVVYDDDRPVRRAQQVSSEDVKRGRTVQKSAIIVGSSAGIGAGVGAAVGGKKGALIGAALGGGGAAIWDQMTRRK
jgi:hypothetical protein